MDENEHLVVRVSDLLVRTAFRAFSSFAWAFNQVMLRYLCLLPLLLCVCMPFVTAQHYRVAGLNFEGVHHSNHLDTNSTDSA
jgi:hypothetical protein